MKFSYVLLLFIPLFIPFSVLPVFSQDFTLTEDIYSEELSRLAQLTINTTPDYADLYIDGTHTGRTDCTLPLPEEGPHVVEFEKPGYEKLSLVIFIKENTGLTIEADLKKLTGNLVIKTSPADAMVTADSFNLQQGANFLPAGSYTIVIRKNGWKTETRTVRLYDKSEKTIEINLVPDSEDVPVPQLEASSEDYRFCSPRSTCSGMMLCISATSLGEGEVNFFCSSGYGNTGSESQAFSLFAGARGAVGNLEISGSITGIITSNFSDNTSTGAAAAVKYRFIGNNGTGLVFSAAMEGSVLRTADKFSNSAYNYLALYFPTEYIFEFAKLRTGVILSPGIRGSFLTAGGDNSTTPIFRLLTPAGLFLEDNNFRIGLSAEAVYPDLGYGFPNFDGIITAADASLRIPGTRSDFSIFVKLGSSVAEAGIGISFTGF